VGHLARVQPAKKKLTSQKQTAQEKLVCQMCGELQNATNFYTAKDPILKTGKVAICKQCIRSYCYVGEQFMVERFKEMLARIGRVFNQGSFDSAVDSGQDLIGTYFKLTGFQKAGNYATLKVVDNTQKAKKEEKVVTKKDFDGRWIDKKYSEAVQLEDFYQTMKRDNRIESAQDEIYLRKLAIINLEMDTSAKEGEWEKFKKLSEIFSKFMGDAKLRSMDKTEADRTGGLRSFGMIYAEVEKEGFIPPWETFKKVNGANQDIVDKTIMHIENFTLKLNKVNRMNTPPSDCPIILTEEIDEHATYNDVGISELADEILGGE